MARTCWAPSAGGSLRRPERPSSSRRNPLVPPSATARLLLPAGLPAEVQMPLPRLVPATGAVPVQETSLSVDALARNVCNTWQEATGNGGPPFSVVVVGAGAYGGYLAAKLAEFQPQRRVLLLEAGPFLVGERVQNLGPVG